MKNYVSSLSYDILNPAWYTNPISVDIRFCSLKCHKWLLPSPHKRKPSISRLCVSSLFPFFGDKQAGPLSVPHLFFPPDPLQPSGCVSASGTLKSGPSAPNAI